MKTTFIEPNHRCPGNPRSRCCRRFALGRVAAMALGLFLLNSLPAWAARIYIETPGKGTLNLEVELDNTIDQIKAKISEMKGIQVQQQSLYFLDKSQWNNYTFLQNHRTLSDYGIQNDDTVLLNEQDLPFSINWFTVAGGGGNLASSSNGQFELSGTAGQHDASPAAASERFSLTAGYWSIVAVVQTEGAPPLSVRLWKQFTVVSWPTPAEGWALQQTDDIVHPNWILSPYQLADDGVYRSIFVPEKTGNRFFRLIKP